MGLFNTSMQKPVQSVVDDTSIMLSGITPVKTVPVKTTTINTRKPLVKPEISSRVTDTGITSKLSSLPDSDPLLFKKYGSIANNPYSKVTPKAFKLDGPIASNPVSASKAVNPLANATKTANIINGANAVVGAGLALYGLDKVSRMKPPTPLQAPVLEAKLLRDRGAAIAANNKTDISTSMNTVTEGLLRKGRTDMMPSLVGKSMNALNQSSAQIEQLRTGIEQANVGAENRIREINANSKMQAGQFNSQIAQQFQQFKSQLSSGILSAGVQNVSANLGGIAQNNYGSAMYQMQQRQGEIDMLRMQTASSDPMVRANATRQLQALKQD